MVEVTAQEQPQVPPVDFLIVIGLEALGHRR